MTIAEDRSTMQLFTFDNLAQRILYRYAFLFADFVPIESDSVSIDAQHTFYTFCESIVRDVADDPAILGVPTDRPDEWLSAHDVMNRHPEVYQVRNACQKAFYDLSGLLFAAGTHGEYRDGRLNLRLSDAPKLTGKTLGTFSALLARYGLSIEKNGDALSFSFPDCPDALLAWQLLARKCGELPISPRDQAVRFLLWVHYDDPACFLEKIRALLNLDEGFFEYVTVKYREQDYEVHYKIDEYRGTCTYSKDVGGLSIEFTTLWPTVRFLNSTCIGIKAALAHADGMSNDIKRQLIKFCKPCNDCKGCTKGGKNMQFTVALHHDDTHRLCPEFVQMEWYNDDISTEKIDFMLELNELQERYGKNWRK